MTSYDKQEIIEHWCYQFHISKTMRNLWCGEIVYEYHLNSSLDQVGDTSFYKSKDGVVHEAYELVNEYVWGMVSTI